MFKFLKGAVYGRNVAKLVKNAGFYGTPVNKREALFPQAEL